MASLLRRANGSPATEVPAAIQPAQSAPPAPGPGRLVQVSLFLADALLVGLMIWVVVRSHGNLGWGGATLCLIALALGAWLSCLALWLRRGVSPSAFHKPER